MSFFTCNLLYPQNNQYNKNTYIYLPYNHQKIKLSNDYIEILILINNINPHINTAYGFDSSMHRIIDDFLKFLIQ